MKIILYVFLLLFSLETVIKASSLDQTDKNCASGPTYWCKSLETSRSCNATSHCIQTVWQHLSLPDDESSICQICLDMVKQARDQLRSNQTQDDLRAVFEGSCELMHVMVTECKKLVDSFVPELIEALSSQMNPQVVCSVAGLCNNDKYDDSSAEKRSTSLNCESCGKLTLYMTKNFEKSSKDMVLENILELCGKMSSFSDACASIVLTHHNDLYLYFEENFDAAAVCHLSGVCDGKFHEHKQKEDVIDISDIGFINFSDPDIPCELCEQLVNHLRDLLIANTTETEFEQVLQGLCGQTKSFKQECLIIVSQYYTEIYEFLTKSLNPRDVCFFVGVCPKSIKLDDKKYGMAPIVPINTQIPKFKSYTKKHFLKTTEPNLNDGEIQNSQLPIDRLMRPSNTKNLVEGGAWCTMCEYFLHFVQEELSDTKNEEKIKKTVMNTCNKMPKSIAPECRNFVDLYADALIALLIQEVDPSAICPQLKICPQNLQANIEFLMPKFLSVDINSEASEKASCPLCLLAVEQAQQLIQTNKTIQRIEETLEHLCNHLRNKLRMECNDFVETYSKELVNMLMKDFTPQEICVYLKLCVDKEITINNFGFSEGTNAEQPSNEIYEKIINGIMVEKTINIPLNSTPQCLLCQEIVKDVEKNVIDKNSTYEIKKALKEACTKIPKKARSKCEEYVEKHGNQIAELIMKELSPKEICRDVQLCSQLRDINSKDWKSDATVRVKVFSDSPYSTKDKQSSQTCIICEILVARIDKNLKKPTTQEEVKKYLNNVCNVLPINKKECLEFVNNYLTLLMQALESIPPKKICKEIKVCPVTEATEEIMECALCEGAIGSFTSLVKIEKQDNKDLMIVLKKSCQHLPARFYENCQKLLKVYGISIIEQLRQNPESHNICIEIGKCYRYQTAGFVNMNSFSGLEKETLVGEHECTWGPSHWCKDERTAKKCNSFDFCKRNQIGFGKA
ncbi:prosaposin isoform X2 [Culicoides brevitarsis]|uniref:prosaposin isoform X2 n=1 Tax=Culicoides brevitarsis TaxID=469753 RepID=UPI00307BC6E7